MYKFDSRAGARAKAGAKGNSRQGLGELSFWYIEYRAGRQAGRQASRGQAEGEMDRQSTHLGDLKSAGN